jgi:hypothetical protein
MWPKQFIPTHENRTMRPVEMVLRKGEGVRGKGEEVNLKRVHCMHVVEVSQ